MRIHIFVLLEVLDVVLNGCCRQRVQIDALNLAAFAADCKLAGGSGTIAQKIASLEFARPKVHGI